MNIHEYQGKALLQRFDVPVPAGQVAFTPEEAERAARALDGPVWVVKAQIHAGGRGKGGGVKVVKSIEDVRTEAGNILGMNLVTHQTGPAGKDVHRVAFAPQVERAEAILLISFELHTVLMRPELSSNSWVFKKRVI